MKIRIIFFVGLFAILMVIVSAQAAGTTAIMAHVTGENYGKVDANIVVTTTEQKVFHFHSDLKGGGGTWYDVFIGIEGKYVKVREYSAAASNKEGNEKMTSTERIFLFPIDMITKDDIDLEMSNHIVLTKKKS